MALEADQRRQVQDGRCGFGGQGTVALLLYASHLQTQLPQQKLQLQEACMRKEKSVALLEQQLMEVEVRGSM